MPPGRKEKQGAPTKSYPIRLSPDRRDRWDRWAATKGKPLADAIRDTIDAACGRAGIS